MSIAEKYGSYKRVLVMGADKVGKTTMITSLINNNFTKGYVPTTGVEVYTDVSRQLQLIDLAGFTNSTYGGSWVQLNSDVIMRQILNGDSSKYFKGADIHAVDAYLIVYSTDRTTEEIAKALRLSLKWKEYRGNNKRPKVYVVRNDTGMSVVRSGMGDFDHGQDEVELTKIKLPKVSEKEKKMEANKVTDYNVTFANGYENEKDQLYNFKQDIHVPSGGGIEKVFDKIFEDLHGVQAVAGEEAEAEGPPNMKRAGSTVGQKAGGGEDRKCKIPDVEKYVCTIS